MAFFPMGRYSRPLISNDFVSAGRIRSGTITDQVIILAGGGGQLRSQNYDTASLAGWGLFGDGSVVILGITFASGGAATTTQILARIGAVGTPGYSYVGHEDTGWFVRVSGELNASVDAEEKVRIEDGASATVFDMSVRRGTALVPFEVGATDSGGSGFRMVRVPN